MELSSVDIYWLDQSGGEPPPALAERAKLLLWPGAEAAGQPAIIFLQAAPSDALRIAQTLRERVGAPPYIILVTPPEGNAQARDEIGAAIDDLCSPEELRDPRVLARAGAATRERAANAQRAGALATRCGHLQSALDALPSPIFLKDARAVYVGCNAAFAAYIGRPADWIIGKTVFNVAPPEFAEIYDRADRELLASGGAQTYEASVEVADGSKRDVMFQKAAYRDEAGKIAGMAGAMLDITRRKRAEEALQESEQRYREVFDNASIGIALIEPTADGQFVYAAINLAAAHACGRSVSELVGAPAQTPLTGAAAVKLIERLRACVERRSVIVCEIATGEGESARVNSCRFAPLFAKDGSVRRIVSVARDVTLARNSERLRREQENRYRALVENSPDAIVRYDRSCRRIFSNKAIFQANNATPNGVVGKTPVEDLLLSDGGEAITYQAWLQSVMDRGVPDSIEVGYRTPRGATRIAHARAIPERDANGDVASVLVVAADIHDRIEAERRLRQREQEFRTLVENSPDLIVRYDTECRRLYVNPAMRKDIGEASTALGATPALGSTLDPQSYIAKMREVIALGEQRELESAYRSAAGALKWRHVRMTPEFDENNAVVSVLAVGRDITEMVEARRKIQHLAFYDSLTGLPNRSLLGERIVETVAQKGERGRFALMLLDLDRFKEVNDTFGHAAGDELLCQVASRLRRCARRSDTVARLGGDEFALLLPDVAAKRNFSAIANRILRALDRPFHVSRREITIFASIGVAENGDSGVDVETLLKQADSAMYHAKRMGRNNFQFFTPQMMARNVMRMTIATDLRKACARGELELYFQPRVLMRAKKTIGAEALLRWRHPELGFLSPDKFIDIAEETGLIVDIGRWVLAEACRQAVEWNSANREPLKISVNLSARQFITNDLVSALRDVLRASGCDPLYLELEITESLLLEDSQSVHAMLQAISDMGVSIAVDDFGTGFSALSYLTRFPIDTLKIDRSFVHDVHRDRKRAELVKAIIAIAAALDMKLVAEGVEDEAEEAFLLSAGCLEAQGYLLGRPMPADAFAAHVAGAGERVRPPIRA